MRRLVEDGCRERALLWKRNFDELAALYGDVLDVLGGRVGREDDVVRAGRDVRDESGEARLGLIDAHRLGWRRGRDVDAAARLREVLEARRRLSFVRRDDVVDRFSVLAACLHLVEEALVALCGARRVAEDLVCAREVVADAIAARRAEIAVERLPERERTGDVVGFVVVEPLFEALAVLRHVRVVVLLSERACREREGEQRGARERGLRPLRGRSRHRGFAAKPKSRAYRHRSPVVREPSSWSPAVESCSSGAARAAWRGGRVTCGWARRSSAACWGQPTLTTSGADAVTVTVTVAVVVCAAGPWRLRDIAKTAADAIAADAAAIIHGASRDGALRVGVPVIARPESGARPEWKFASAASSFCFFVFAACS